MVRREMEITSDLKELRRVREFVRAFCRMAWSATGRRCVTALELAVNEAASNIMKHAYHGRDDQWIHLEAEAFPDYVSIQLHHLGDPFDPLAVPAPALDGSRDSGFGAYIISKAWIRCGTTAMNAGETVSRWLRPEMRGVNSMEIPVDKTGRRRRRGGAGG